MEDELDKMTPEERQKIYDRIINNCNINKSNGKNGV